MHTHTNLPPDILQTRITIIAPRTSITTALIEETAMIGRRSTFNSGESVTGVVGEVLGTVVVEESGITDVDEGEGGVGQSSVGGCTISQSSMDEGS